MIEEGGIYKLKKIKDFFGTNTEEEFKVLKIDGDTVYCQNVETKELNMFNKNFFIDPEFPDDIYSDVTIVWEKLEKVMKPMNLSFWKDLKEEVSCGALGAAPCPAMGQITGGNVSGCLINGIPVAGESVKKKKKKKDKKNEVYLNGTNHIKLEFDENNAKVYISIDDTEEYSVDIDRFMNNVSDFIYDSINNDVFEFDVNWFEHFGKLNRFLNKLHETDFTKLRNDLAPDEVKEYNNIKDKEEYLNDDSASPIYTFKHAEDPEVEFDDAINLLLFGQDENDKNEYNELIEFIDNAGRLEEYEKYALDKYGINDITGDSIGKQVDITPEEVVDEIFNEDFNEEYDEITEQISKYLDRLNFKYANTEDIIYKKEGENKYLFKFDNEIGVIKIKVLHGDDILVEKEYEIDETEDIQPIFDEIESIYKEYGL